MHANRGLGLGVRVQGSKFTVRNPHTINPARCRVYGVGCTPMVINGNHSTQHDDTSTICKCAPIPFTTHTDDVHSRTDKSNGSCVLSLKTCGEYRTLCGMKIVLHTFLKNCCREESYWWKLSKVAVIFVARHTKVGFLVGKTYLLILWDINVDRLNEKHNLAGLCQ